MKFNTENKNQAFKQIMRLLGQQNLTRPVATKKLSHPETGVYKRTRDAKEFLKDLVNEETIPIDVVNGELARTDIRGVKVEA